METPTPESNGIADVDVNFSNNIFSSSLCLKSHAVPTLSIWPLGHADCHIEGWGVQEDDVIVVFI